MKVIRMLLVLTIIAAVAVGLAIAQGPPAGGAGGGQRGGGGAAGGGGQRGGGGGRGGGGIPNPVVITSTAYTDGGDIPAKYAGNMGVSPALSWTGAPMGTQSFAIIMHDTDVTLNRGTADVLHWMIWDIPGTATGMPEGVKAGDLPDGSRNGRNIANQNGYMGPAPPAGHPVHHYVIELYALDAKLNLPPESTRDQLIAAMGNHVLAKGTYYGKFKPQ